MHLKEKMKVGVVVSSTWNPLVSNDVNQVEPQQVFIEAACFLGIAATPCELVQLANVHEVRHTISLDLVLLP